MGTTWCKRNLGLKREERGADKTFHSVSRLRFISLHFNLAVLTRDSPFLWEYQAPTLHICSPFPAAAKVPVNMPLFSALFLLLLDFFRINASSREKEGGVRGEEETRCCNFIWVRNLVFCGSSCYKLDYLSVLFNQLLPLLCFVGKYPVLVLTE